jgi:hypothetical protein
MKRSTSLFLSALMWAVCTVALAAMAHAEPAPAAPDYQAIATAIRQQRDSATQALQDTQLQLALAQQQIQALTTAKADLQKQIDAAKPKAKAMPVVVAKPAAPATQPVSK